MNRELSIDATQVALGDDSTLTLTLDADAGEDLLKWLGQFSCLALSFDHLADSRAPETHLFHYHFDSGTLVFDEPLRRHSLRPTSRAKPLYGELELMSPRLALAGKTSLTVEWDVRVVGAEKPAVLYRMQILYR